MERVEIAKNLLIGKTCDNCIHKINIYIDRKVCRHPSKNRSDIPKENTCELWWQWGDEAEFMMHM